MVNVTDIINSEHIWG